MVDKLKIYKILTILVIGFVFLGLGCTGKNSGRSIYVKGSDTIKPLAEAEAEKFMEKNPGKSIIVKGGGSSVGIEALINGMIDIADASREMTDKEIEAAQKNGINPVQHTIAYDGITVIVNSANPVSTLTFDQLRGIYNGSISNWKDVSGQDKPIVVNCRKSSSGTYKTFQTIVMHGDNYRHDALNQADTGSIVISVSQNSDAIGYIGFSYFDNSSIKALSLNNGKGSIFPTYETIHNGSYPLSRALNMYTNGEATGLKKEFIDFVLSEQGQEIATGEGFIPLKSKI
ncbi:Phosphate ABC transporter, periplasmic phosphate-binding protein PstS [Methanosarcina siciliae C2J]|uniref:Phosphate ABC transporter, periplasmic phosphate-binding protein PstS n=1 Tax=Methanosarcina siciliae C2J TaxID=1434118 RepID=A0A0E3PQF0_9EURY|nr:PstS family phosphate ABC transporter substrate-binding protein [Methanosarcina siciliae]AKB37260.1 Phosphate ABC transporter, periplasmic phosphate-binding protein PstS [Methanosarcina siciliae C2J]